MQMLKGLKWWEIALCGSPLLLFFVGGMIGALFGLLGSTLNVKIWKHNYNMVLKIVLITVITALSFVLYLAFATLFLSLTRQ